MLSVAVRDPCAWRAKLTFTMQVVPGSIAGLRDANRRDLELRQPCRSKR
jgi:hypothetical protein